ncbi:hypothetical protein G6F22_020102 [Rhizopus arrhizus]|nr:hypothetical protein G6F22_020102 [Rhizopus arrhizus]
MAATRHPSCTNAARASPPATPCCRWRSRAWQDRACIRARGASGAATRRVRWPRAPEAAPIRNPLRKPGRLPWLFALARVFCWQQLPDRGQLHPSRDAFGDFQEVVQGRRGQPGDLGHVVPPP